jgi:hypothetical protein
MVVVSVLSTAIASAQNPTPERQSAIARTPDVDVRISLADALDPTHAEYVMELGLDRAREITAEEELEERGGQFLAARLHGSAVRQFAQENQVRYVLPYRFGQIVPGVNDRLNLRAVAVVEQGGLRVDPDTVSYRGWVRVGIENEDDPSAPRADLQSPVLFEFTFDAGSVSPESLLITHTNLPFEKIGLGTVQAPREARLNIRASFDTAGEDIEVPVVPVKVLSAPEAIPGLGFGFCDVNVQLPGFLAGRITDVTLSATSGHLEPSHVALSETGHGQSVLWSAFVGSGETRIEVVRDDLFFEPLTVRFFWPWVLVLAVVAGAAVSGGIFAITKTKGGFLLGLLIGFVAGIAICGGINLTNLRAPVFATVLVAFVFAAIPGFVVARKIWRPQG